MSSAGHLSAFKYEPLDQRISRKCIRLLHLLPQAADGIIRCTIQNNVSISEKPNLFYTPVSYEWGDIAKPNCDIEVNGWCFKITQNLFDFLTSLLHQHPRTGLENLWVDAICIDQSNTKEKSQQVAQMHDIFQNAPKVLAWLGPTAEGSDVLFDFLNSASIPTQEDKSDAAAAHSLLREGWNNPQYLFYEAGAQIHNAMKKLCSRTYWTRMWIIQEVLLARKLDLVCGLKCAPWLHFAIIMEALLGQSSMFVNLKKMINNSSVRSILEHWILRARGAAVKDLETLFITFRQFHCSEPRDKVYALRSISSDAALIPVDYESPIEDVLLHLLKTFRQKLPYTEFSSLCQMFGIKPWTLVSLFKEQHLYSYILEAQTASEGYTPVHSLNLSCSSEDVFTIYTSLLLELGGLSSGGGAASTWSNLMKLSSKGRLKKCNCTACTRCWQNYAQSISSSQNLHCGRHELRIVRDLKVILFFQTRMKDENYYPVYFATGILLGGGDDISPLSDWYYHQLLHADQGGAYVLLYHDPAMAQDEFSNSNCYTMSQLLTWTTHQYPRIRFGGEGGRELSLSPQCKQLKMLESVTIEGDANTIYTDRKNRMMEFHSRCAASIMDKFGL